MTSGRCNANTWEHASIVYRLMQLHAASEWDIAELEHGVREITLWRNDEDEPVYVARVSSAGRIYSDRDQQGEAA